MKPRKPAPTAAVVAVLQDDDLVRLSDQLDQAHEANGNNPTINGLSDWIPEYVDDN